MKLIESEVHSIKRAFIETFEDGKIYLFGSRVDDSKRGGDIDLYLCPSKVYDDERQRKINFLVKLDEYIGEQKVDAMLAKNKDRLIEKEAIRTGIEL